MVKNSLLKEKKNSEWLLSQRACVRVYVLLKACVNLKDQWGALYAVSLTSQNDRHSMWIQHLSLSENTIPPPSYKECT